MKLHFATAYTSKPGEKVFVNLNNAKNDFTLSLQLNYKNENTWDGSIFLVKETIPNKICYEIFVRNELSPKKVIFLYKGTINLKKVKSKSINIINREKTSDHVIDVRLSKPYTQAFKPFNSRSSESCSNKKATHIFKVSYPMLQENIFLCLTGSAKKLNLFNNENPVLFRKKKNNKSVLKFNFSKETFPIEYKIAFYDAEKKCIVDYEDGPNNLIQKPIKSKNGCIIFSEPDCKNYLWKATGINIPVFSLRTNDTWGSGDFGAIKSMVDYASAIGIKMIQLLPVNDTIATFTDKDSYPYSAISSFALNPLYLNVEKITRSSNFAISE